MNIPETVQSMDDTSKLVILSATVIVVFILFSKTIKVILKIAVIAVMLVVIAYFLRQNGII